MIRRVFLLTCAAVLSPLTSATAAVSRVPVYVRGAAATAGWTDPSGERDDSAKDLIRHLQSPDRRYIRHAPSEAEGVIVLEVVARHKEYRTLVLTVRLTAGDFTTEISGRSDVSTGSWRNCALTIVKKLDEWAQANRARLAPRTDGA